MSCSYLLKLKLVLNPVSKHCVNAGVKLITETFLNDYLVGIINSTDTLDQEVILFPDRIEQYSMTFIHGGVQFKRYDYFVLESSFCIFRTLLTMDN